jgi:mxaA protein
MNKAQSLALALCYLVNTMGYAAGPIHAVDVEPAAAATVAIGEVFTQNIRISTAKNVRLEAEYLPHPGDTLENGIEISAVDWNRQESDSEHRFELHLSYQLFRGVRGQERVAIPELKLHFMADGRPLESIVPAWEIKLASMIPADQIDADVRIREPLPHLPYPLTGELQAFGLALLSLAPVYLSGAWILALPPFRWRRRMPFEQAWHELNKLAKRPASAAIERLAFRIVHKALNRSAGYTVFNDRLDRYLGEKPVFEPLRGQFEHFFTGSWLEFFAPPNVGWVGFPSPTQRSEPLGCDGTATQPTVLLNPLFPGEGRVRAKAPNVSTCSPQALSAPGPHPNPLPEGEGAKRVSWLLELAKIAMELEQGQP